MLIRRLVLACSELPVFVNLRDLARPVEITESNLEGALLLSGIKAGLLEPIIGELLARKTGQDGGLGLGLQRFRPVPVPYRGAAPPRCLPPASRSGPPVS